MAASIIMAIAKSLRLLCDELRKQPPDSSTTETLESTIRNTVSNLNTELNNYFTIMSPKSQTEAVLWRSAQALGRRYSF